MEPGYPVHYHGGICGGCGRNTLVAIFLGVDGGGSKTSCVVGNETAILGRGVAGGSNLVRMGEARAWETIASAIQQACTNAGIATFEISRACIGLAGSADPQLSDNAARTMAKLFVGEIQLVTDAAIALHAAFGGAPGIIVIAGTGSIAYGRTPDGSSLRAGGWGFAVADEGSGYWIGRTAVSIALRAFDEGDEVLLAHLISAWKLKTHEQMIVQANASPAPDFAGLFPAVLAAAENDNHRAQNILAQAGSELARIAKIVIKRGFSDAGPVQVAMSGGVFQNSILVRESFYNHLRAEFPDAQVNVIPIDPVLGALEMARNGVSKPVG